MQKLEGSSLLLFLFLSNHEMRSHRDFLELGPHLGLFLLCATSVGRNFRCRGGRTCAKESKKRFQGFESLEHRPHGTGGLPQVYLEAAVHFGSAELRGPLICQER